MRWSLENYWIFSCSFWIAFIVCYYSIHINEQQTKRDNSETPSTISWVLHFYCCWIANRPIFQVLTCCELLSSILAAFTLKVVIRPLILLKSLRTWKIQFRIKLWRFLPFSKWWCLFIKAFICEIWCTVIESSQSMGIRKETTIRRKTIILFKNNRRFPDQIPPQKLAKETRRSRSQRQVRSHPSIWGESSNCITRTISLRFAVTRCLSNQFQFLILSSAYSQLHLCARENHSLPKLKSPSITFTSRGPLAHSSLIDQNPIQSYPFICFPFSKSNQLFYICHLASR